MTALDYSPRINRHRPGVKLKSKRNGGEGAALFYKRFLIHKWRSEGDTRHQEKDRVITAAYNSRLAEIDRQESEEKRGVCTVLKPQRERSDLHVETGRWPSSPKGPRPRRRPHPAAFPKCVSSMALGGNLGHGRGTTYEARGHDR